MSLAEITHEQLPNQTVRKFPVQNSICQARSIFVIHSHSQLAKFLMNMWNPHCGIVDTVTVLIPIPFINPFLED